MLLVFDAHADRAALGVVGQGEEDVLLPAVADEEAAQRRIFEHGMSLLHAQRSPVEATALQLGDRVRDDVTVLFAGEHGEVSEVHTGYRSLDRSWRRAPL